jgi:hypothetical protein
LDEIRKSRKRKMSQDSDDDDNNGERPNSAYIPSLPLTRKRLRDKEASSNADQLRNGNGPGNKTATRSAEFVVDIELADVEVPPKKN